MQTNVKRITQGVTHEGAAAVPMNAAQELRRAVMACLLWEDTYYESGQSVASRIDDLASQVEPSIVSALAIEAREKMKLRHVPLWLCVTLARRGALTASLVERVVQRPDELCELLSLYSMDRTGTKRLNKLSKAIQRGLARAFTKFSAYDLAKYDRDKGVKLRDVLFLCHAKPKDEEQAATWKKLIGGTLEAPNTWEVRLSAGEDKKTVFEDLIATKQLGALALLRNLRNMEQAGVSRDVIANALQTMRTDRVLPFRFIAAARAVPSLEQFIEPAMMRALGEQPKLPGRTVLIVDNSGSMNSQLSAKSDLTRSDAACALGVLLREICDDCRVISFSSRPVEVPARHGFALVDAVLSATERGSTMTQAALTLANSKPYDRVIIVTDEQSHQAISGPMGKGYIINVAAYQHGIGFGPWTHIDGWSESIVEYIRATEG